MERMLHRQSNQFQIFKGSITRFLEQPLSDALVGAAGAKLVALSLIELGGRELAFPG